ncbi:MAG: Sortase A, LPXTG specific, partial [uncultured Rubrobacteraceae bacterium]
EDVPGQEARWQDLRLPARHAHDLLRAGPPRVLLSHRRPARVCCHLRQGAADERRPEPHRARDAPRGRHSRVHGPRQRYVRAPRRRAAREQHGLPVAGRLQRVHRRPPHGLPRHQELSRLQRPQRAGERRRGDPHGRGGDALHIHGLQKVRRQPRRLLRHGARPRQERRKPPDLHPAGLRPAPHRPGRAHERCL